MDERLFPVAPDAITMSAAWSWPDGWVVTFWSHTSGTGGPDTEAARYERLATTELFDVVTSEIARRLKLV